jgi:hypothetical protein
MLIERAGGEPARLAMAVIMAVIASGDMDPPKAFGPNLRGPSVALETILSLDTVSPAVIYLPIVAGCWETPSGFRERRYPMKEVSS